MDDGRWVWVTHACRDIQNEKVLLNEMQSTNVSILFEICFPLSLRNRFVRRLSEIQEIRYLDTLRLYLKWTLKSMAKLILRHDPSSMHF